MTHRTCLERAAHVLATVSLAFGILAAAPIAEGFRRDPESFPFSRQARAPLAAFAPGDLVARVALPRLGIDAPIYEGVGGETLSRGAGHLPGTALPGDEAARGNSLLAVPRDSAAAGLAGARVGDAVTMRTPFGVREYRVSERRVCAPDAVQLTGRAGSRVTIVTPFPADALGPAPMRLALVLEPRG